jgi:hypothetical protein
VDPVGDTLVGQVEALLADIVADPATSGVQTLSQAAEQVTGAAQPVGDTVSADALGDPVGTVTQTAESVTGTGGNPGGGAVETVTQVAESVTGTGGNAVGSAVETVARTTEPVSAAVESTSETASGQVSSLVGAGGAGGGGGDGGAGADATRVAEPVTGPAESSPVPSGDDAIQTLVPATEPREPIQSTLAEPGDDGAALSDPVVDAAQALVGLGADEAALAGGAIVTLAGLAVLARQAGPSVTFFLANARPIPIHCAVRETVHRYASGAAAVASGLGWGGGVRASTGQAVLAAHAATDDFAQAIRDGFLLGAGRSGIGVSDDGASDARLAMQIGMLLGTVYLAFLTVWYWATRLRWNPRT